MRSKWHQLLAWMVIAVALLASGIAGAEEKTLSVLMFSGAERAELFSNYVVPRFEALHPGVKVDLITEGNIEAATEKLMVMMASGTPPDVAYIRHWEFPEYVKKGMVIPLDDMIARSHLDLRNLPPAVMQGIMSYNGKIYGLPSDGFGFNNSVMYVNIDLFQKAGLQIPTINYDNLRSGWSYTDFRNIAKKLTFDQSGDGVPDIWGFSFGAGVSTNWFQLVWNFGGDVIDRNTYKVRIDEEKSVKAFEYMYQLKFQDNAAGGTNQLFRKGKTAVAQTAYGLIANLMADKVAFDWTLLPTPYGDGGRYGIATSNPLSIPTAAKHKEEAFEFIRFTLSDEVQIYMADSNLIPPQTRSAVVRKEFLYSAKPPHDKSALVFGPSQALPIWTPGWVDIDTVFMEQTTAYWAGKSTLATMLETLKSRINQIVRDKK